MSRANIHYWKCDRPATLHGTSGHSGNTQAIAKLAQSELCKALGASNVTLTPFRSQGNHLTWLAKADGQPLFLRVENGPENDPHIEVESALTRLVAKSGVRVPKVFAVDGSRKDVPFAWQAIEYFELADLNTHLKAGRLDTKSVAREIGNAVAKWQSISTIGFGIFNAASPNLEEPSQAYHTAYHTYYHLRLEDHLGYLCNRQFLSLDDTKKIEHAIASHSGLLQIPSGCFVHKDLALWNILGSPARAEAFIDFDDAISGDPMDDLSLLACFHNADFINSAILGYQTICPLPEEHHRRLWLHLLRNMIVKSVIRIGAGYFDRKPDLFLIGAQNNALDLRTFTKERIFTALSGLNSNSNFEIL